jgi:hypothetical protein
VIKGHRRMFAVESDAETGENQRGVRTDAFLMPLILAHAKLVGVFFGRGRAFLLNRQHVQPPFRSAGYPLGESTSEAMLQGYLLKPILIRQPQIVNTANHVSAFLRNSISSQWMHQQREQRCADQVGAEHGRS